MERGGTRQKLVCVDPRTWCFYKEHDINNVDIFGISVNFVFQFKKDFKLHIW